MSSANGFVLLGYYEHDERNGILLGEENLSARRATLYEPEVVSGKAQAEWLIE
jgi:hypothetical protein